MGNKVSTTRKLDKLAKNSNINRSSINQLPKDSLKQKYQQDVLNATSNLSFNNPTSSQSKSSQNPQESQSPYSFQGGREHQPTTFQSSHPGTPPGKDGFDPQGPDPASMFGHQSQKLTSPDQNSDFIKIINNLGRSVRSDTDHIKLQSDAINQLNNRKQLEKKAKDKINDPNYNDTVIDSKILTTILLELNDTRYPVQQILKDYDLSQEDLAWLNRFKVANNYKEFKSDNKEGEINHEPRVQGKTLMDEELRRENRRDISKEHDIDQEQDHINASDAPTSDTNVEKLKKRLSLDD